MTCGARAAPGLSGAGAGAARRGGGAGAAALMLLVVVAAALALPYADAEDNHESVAVTACLPGAAGRAAAALAELAARALAGGGLPARRAPPPAACVAPARPDAAACLRAAERALAAGRLAAALLPAPAAAAPSAWRLRDAGLDVLGDLLPPAHRTCWALPVAAPGPAPAPRPLRSLLDLSDADVAMHYVVSANHLKAAARNASVTLASISFKNIKSPEWCDTANASCATLLTSGEDEALALLDTVREHGLRARVLALGPRLPALARALPAPAVVCDWALETTEFAARHARPLGPPPCSRDDCLFENRRVVKLVRATDLARSPAALRALIRLALDFDDVRALTALTRDLEPGAAAQRFLEERPMRVAPREVRVAVFLPAHTPREAYDGVELAAAAALAEEDLEAEGRPLDARFEVEVYDDGCDAARAYKYLLDALGTGAYGTLAAVVGPACGAAFADVARQSPAHALPVVAYSAQAPPAGPALLAAGDARAAPAALAAWLAYMRWRRVAVVSELATRAACDTARLRVNIVEHLELTGGDEVEIENIEEWAQRVARARGRIIYLCLEDARAVRAALCAGRAAALRPERGAVWILPAALPADWSSPKAGDAHNCTLEELEETAAGHLSLGPEWLVNWRNGMTTSNASSAAWQTRWRTQCGRLAGGAACARAGPHAALLYDALRLWAAALQRELAARGAALHLHDPDVVRSLVTTAASDDFIGVTGRFEWSLAAEDGAAYARESPLIVSQGDPGAGPLRELARWTGAALQVGGPPRWGTPDGAAPDDGGDDCALRPLAELLRADCAAAVAALGALLLALAVAALAAAALYCRRRAERDYRAKLEALGLRALVAAEPAGLDRWELPRERVVINRKLGMGAFGTVYGGHALLAEGRSWTAVAVKTLKPGASVDEKLDFLSEAEAMKRFDHRNVVRLLAVVTKTEPVCTVMEFMLYGDLKNYLLARRHLATGGEGGEGGEEEGEEGEADEVSARRLTAMALDAARALAYLARLRYVHRDVAARNCLVSSRRVVKLADFGMTRLVFENDYYRFSRKGMLPVRWMAPESLALGVFSPASDVWSFGVLLYEIITFGSLPFQGLSNSEVLARVKAGHTLDLPPGISPQLEELIASCWRRERAARPAAAALAAALGAAPRLLAPCPDAPLDALPLDPPWHLPPDRAQARWVSWGAGAAASQSQATDTTYLSDAAPRDSDRFLPDG